VLAEATEERLKKYFEEELSESERERLLSLPADEMQRQLKRSFVMSRLPGEGRPFSPQQPMQRKQPGRNEKPGGAERPFRPAQP